MKIFAVGRNYAAHIEELDNERPDSPVIFSKPDTAIPQRNMPFFYPDFSSDVHFEVEIVLKINRVGKHIPEKFAHKYFDAIALGIDFTARDLQLELKEKGLPWDLAKGFDGSGPVSDFYPISDFRDINNLGFSLKQNGELRQEGNTSLMLFTFSEIISYISTYFTLKKGDLIFTGTPSGVGPVKKGDILTGKLEEKQVLEVHVK